MSADYSFYALLCGFMPRPEGGTEEKNESSSLFLCVFLKFEKRRNIAAVINKKMVMMPKVALFRE